MQTEHKNHTEKLASPSRIVQFISESEIKGENWHEKLKSLNIRVSEDDNSALAIFNYGVGGDFSNLIVQEARGIIIDLDQMEVVCWPFRKFGNWNESYADTIDWESAKITEKIDGSIVKLYYYNNQWNWATNSTIHAENAPVGEGGRNNFLQVIHQAENYDDISFEKLDTETTYIFELVSPETQVVLYYPKTELFHIGTRNNKTGQESSPWIGIEKPKLYDGNEGKDLEFWKRAAQNMNDELEHEGLVVVDKNYNRVKIKTPEYLIAHRDMTSKLSEEMAIKLLVENDQERITNFSKKPRNKAKLAFYNWQLAELEADITHFIMYARGYYKEVEGDRASLARAIKGERFAKYGFAAVDRQDMTAREMIEKTPVKAIRGMISHYGDREKSHQNGV